MVSNKDCTGKEILNMSRQAPRGTVIAKHGPYALTAADLLTLEEGTWIMGQVLDATLYSLSQTVQSTLHLAANTMTKILNGDIVDYSRFVMKHDLVMGPDLIRWVLTWDPTSGDQIPLKMYQSKLW